MGAGGLQRCEITLRSVENLFKQLFKILKKKKKGQKYECNMPVNILDSWKNIPCVRWGCILLARVVGVPLGN